MFQKGLKDVVAVHTKIADVNGVKGELRYRGVLIGQVVKQHSFEQLLYFLLNGQFPNEEQLQHVQVELIENRALPQHVQAIIDALPPDVTLMDAMRTAISAYCDRDFLRKNIEAQAIQLIAALPVIIARHYRNQQGLELVESDANLNHTANYLWMLTGSLPTSVQVEALETYLKLTMEHGLNASTFAGRVTISTESDLPAAITSAIGTMKGPLHGGAPAVVIDLLNEIGTPDNIRTVIEQKIANGDRIMGFGHRVYKTEDPRSVLLREKCQSMSGQDAWLDLATVAEQEIIRLLDKHKPGRKLYTNVEYYAAAIMRSIDMPPALFTPTFSVARIVGWAAHAIEQQQDNTIFRPQSLYIGPMKEKDC